MGIDFLKTNNKIIVPFTSILLSVPNRCRVELMFILEMQNVALNINNFPLVLQCSRELCCIPHSSFTLQEQLHGLS